MEFKVVEQKLIWVRKYAESAGTVFQTKVERKSSGKGGEDEEIGGPQNCTLLMTS